MTDVRTEIREAFAQEQSAFALPPGVRREVVEAVIARQNAGSRDVGRQPNHQWLAVAAAILITVAIVAGLMSARWLTSHPTVVKPGPAPQLCISGTAQSTDRFVQVHGCITYSNGSQIVAVDPYHPKNRIILGPSNGQLPIAWSRDGTRLLLASTTDLYVTYADGSVVRLTNGDGSFFGASFSPDGAKVVYVGYSASTSGLYVVDVRGGAPRLLAASTQCSNGPCTTDSSYLQYPAWSPDGSRIAYVSYRSTGDEIWTMSSDGTAQRRLLDVGRCGANQFAGCTNGLAWSPDGSQLAFHSGGGIYVMSANGSDLYKISKDGGQPTWSPDGSRIAFTRGGELFTMASNGSDVTLLQGVVVVPNYAWAWNPARR